MQMDFDNLFSVAGKTVVITGGSRGIGEMMAAGFLKAGAKVIISSRKAAACEEAVERLKAYGDDIGAIPSDMSTMDGVNHLASELAKVTDKVDVLINNAGVYMEQKELSAVRTQRALHTRTMCPLRRSDL